MAVADTDINIAELTENGGGGGKEVLTSPFGTIKVVETEEGHEIEIGEPIVEKMEEFSSKIIDLEKKKLFYPYCFNGSYGNSSWNTFTYIMVKCYISNKDNNPFVIRALIRTGNDETDDIEVSIANFKGEYRLTKKTGDADVEVFSDPIYTSYPIVVFKVRRSDISYRIFSTGSFSQSTVHTWTDENPRPYVVDGWVEMTALEDSIKAKDTTYDNSKSGLNANNTQDAIDELGGKLGGFKLIIVSIVPTDTTFTNFAVLDQSQIQSIIQARENNEKFIVVIEMTIGSSTKQCYIGYTQGDSGDKQYFEMLLDLDFGEIFNQYGLKMSFRMLIRYEDASVTFVASPTQMVLTYDQYQQIESQGGIKHNCTYLIK